MPTRFNRQTSKKMKKLQRFDDETNWMQKRRQKYEMFPANDRKDFDWLTQIFSSGNFSGRGWERKRWNNRLATGIYFSLPPASRSPLVSRFALEVSRFALGFNKRLSCRLPGEKQNQQKQNDQLWKWNPQPRQGNNTYNILLPRGI